MDIKYRKATLDDLRFLLELRMNTMDEHLINAGFHYNENHHRERIFDHFHESLIIHVNNQPVGVIKLSEKTDRLHIRQFQIIPSFQRKGIGSQVLTQIQQRAKLKTRPVTLNVLKNNPALALYQRAGFSIIESKTTEFFMKWS